MKNGDSGGNSLKLLYCLSKLSALQIVKKL